MTRSVVGVGVEGATLTWPATGAEAADAGAGRKSRKISIAGG